jgi:hypothetical protein
MCAEKPKPKTRASTRAMAVEMARSVTPAIAPAHCADCAARKWRSDAIRHCAAPIGTWRNGALEAPFCMPIVYFSPAHCGALRRNGVIAWRNGGAFPDRHLHRNVPGSSPRR